MRSAAYWTPARKIGEAWREVRSLIPYLYFWYRAEGFPRAMGHFFTKAWFLGYLWRARG